ncbi:unnamed protein product [Amoebophrya sp. A25]|nr:unnamed protein product [Amoebophrya sp. A25]|eukprot:GSA25T00007416001.1
MGGILTVKYPQTDFPWYLPSGDTVEVFPSSAVQDELLYAGSLSWRAGRLVVKAGGV